MDKALLQRVLDALYSDDVDKQSWAKTDLMKAIAQPEQPARSFKALYKNNAQGIEIERLNMVIETMQTDSAQPAAVQPLTDEQRQTIISINCKRDSSRDDCERVARAIEAAIKAQPVPAGMCFVPIEPTIPMMDAAKHINADHYFDDPTWVCADIYRAMIAAHIKAEKD